MVDGFDSTAFHALPKVMEKAVSHLPLPALRCSHKRVCEGAGIMTKTLLRSAIAAIIGIVVAFGLIWLVQYAGSEISPDVYDPNSGEILIPIGSTIALIVGWFMGTFAGGWLAMRVSAEIGRAHV